MASIKLHNPVLAENSSFRNLVLESLASDPTVVGIQNAGRIWFNTTDKKVKGTFLKADGVTLETKVISDSADITILNTRLTSVENEVAGKFGNLTTLTTTAKNTVVAAINDVNAGLTKEVADRISADNTKVDKINISAGSVGSQTVIPTINFNAQGQITSVVENSIQVDLQGVTDKGNTSTKAISLHKADNSAGLTADFLSTAGDATVGGNAAVTGNETVGGTLGVTGKTTVTTLDATGKVAVSDDTNSTTSATGAVTVAGGVGVAKDVNIGGTLTVTGSSKLGNVAISGNTVSSTGNVEISATGSVKVGALTLPQTDGAAGAVLVTDGSGTLSLQTITTAISGNSVPLGNPTVGTLTDNQFAIQLTSATKVTDAIDKLNEVMGKMVPPQPPAFPNGALSISSLSSGLRMADFLQTDNTTAKTSSLTGGTTVSAYRRANTYTTNTLTNVGPGESGTVTVYKNGVASGARAIASTLTNNGTYSDLVISNNVDYGTISGKALLFWNSFNASASGTVTEGWNGIKIGDSAAGTTNEAIWYYDASNPGNPVITQTTFAPTTEAIANSSSVPHYTSTTVWTYTGTVNKLSGDMYQASNNVVTGTAGGQFQTPTTVTYATAGITTPLTRNMYVSSGSATFTTAVSTLNATGSSNTGPSLTSNNGYGSGSLTATVTGTILTINTTDTSKVNEQNVTVGTFGTGGASSAIRISGLDTGLSPTIGATSAWNSDSALQTHEATVVAGIAKHDTTDYSNGYFPVGPNLSSGRAAQQYITFRIQRSAVSKFNISLTGKISGCQVALPGSSIDTTALPTHGWIDATVAYSGAGIPGSGAGGSGSAGCALGGAVTTGSLTTQSRTVTFGTESSTNSTNNYIFVRFALSAGDTITALSFANPTN